MHDVRYSRIPELRRGGYGRPGITDARSAHICDPLHIAAVFNIDALTSLRYVRALQGDVEVHLGTTTG